MYETYLIRILLAAAVGAAIGFEREYRDKSAGFRTMILIATGSAFFTIISDIMGDAIGDNTRIAAAVVSGIGFLGAGVIIKDNDDIYGITTAASVWLVASLGMGMGLGLYVLSGAVAVAILLVLWTLPVFERWVDSLYEFVSFRIVVKNTDKQEEKVVALFKSLDMDQITVRRSQEKPTERILHIRAKTNLAKRQVLGRALANEKAVLEFDT